MTKKEKFVKTIDDGFFSKININELDPDVLAYWDALKGNNDSEKPLFTDNGKLILTYLQSIEDGAMLKAKDIADGMGIGSRTVSGSIRKLVTDGFVEKIGKDPVVYALTEQGKNIEIN